ncbi:hypothetical protein IWW36_001803 [Coemansia brasiliensis]|uniref:Peptidase S1 domain-containing protein n=1 Tax=Coemansia brasiliensis TaxID=2650707 RepID=A0A9W8M0I2_9FUNG|nr:hypothetical protein IWW36_001803 [Coemansia brasiliensis]
MKYWPFGYLALVWILSTQVLSALSRRGLSQDDLNTIVGALLFKNGRQTTCEIALMDLKSGLLSANCLDFDDGLSLKQTTEYEVYVTTGPENLFPKAYKLALDDIHVHPDYDQTSLAYNIAVVEFNKNTSSTYEAYLYTGTFYASNSSLVRRSYDHDIGIWNTPTIIPLPTNEDDCGEWNGIYKRINFFACNSVVTTSLFDKSCAMPFGTIYNKEGGRIGVQALYGNSVIFSEDKCSSSNRWLNYYPYMEGFISFAANVLNRPIKVTNSSGLYEIQPSDINEFIHDEPASVDYTGKTQIGGDIFAARNEFYGPLIDPTSEVRSMPQETSSDFESLSESSIDSSLDDSLDNSPDSSGLERSQILAIAITIPLSIVCITAAIGLFYYRRLKSKRTRNRDDDDDWDPYAERLNIRELANEIRGIGDPIQPPSYNEVMRPPSTPSPGPSTENQATQSSSKKKSTKKDY